MTEEEPRSEQGFVDSIPEGFASPALTPDSRLPEEEPRSIGVGEGPPPRKRRRIKRRRLVLVITGVVIVFIIGAAFVTAEYTGRSSFCRSCHEMEVYYKDWQASTHAEAGCRDCHIPPGLVSFVKTKLLSFREIWVHITNTATPPLAVTRKIPDANCLACHADPGDAVLGDASFSHAAHADLECVSCHARLVHRDVNPPYYVDPATKPACLVCHDGKTASDRCSYCHTPPHNPMGECDVCHTQQGWTGASFTHTFPLSGAHASLACADCHVAKTGVGNIQGTQLPRADPACISCHGDEHGGLTDCASCHTPEGWTPANFAHTFSLTGAHASLACADCHVAKTGVGNIPGTQLPQAGSGCVSCHGDEHGGLTDCASCHTPERWTPANFTHPRVGEHIPGGEERLDCASCHKSGFGSHSCTPCHSGTPGGD